MLDAGVLTFGDFVMKSGRPSPYFINTGNYRTGAQIHALGSYYAAAIKETLGDGFEVMFGPAYKGIPLVTAAAYALAQNYAVDKPFAFNRKETKDHGEGGSIVGYHPQANDRIILIEDVITAGTATRESVELMRQAAPGARITTMFISFNRGEIGTGNRSAVQEIGEQFGITVHSLVDVHDLCDYLQEQGGNAEMLQRMEAHIAKYCVAE